MPDERKAGLAAGELIADYHRLYYGENGVFPAPVTFDDPTPTYLGSVQDEAFRTDIYYHLKTAQFQIRLHKNGSIDVEAWAVRRQRS